MHWNRQDVWVILGCVLYFLLYLSGAATTIQAADSAEFLTVATTAGIAHPSGYPLYTMLGYLAQSLSPWPGPQTMGALAGLITVVTLIGIYACVRHLTDSRLAAGLGASIAAVSSHLWHHATFAEAFAMLGCFAAWLTYFALRGADSRLSLPQRRRAFFLYALLAGLASTHHQTIIFTAPLGLYLFYHTLLAPGHRFERRGRAFLLGLFCLLLGLSPFLYLFVRGPQHPPGSWGGLNSTSAVVGHILRKEYGTFSSGHYKSKRPPGYHAISYLSKSLRLQGSFPWGLFAFWMFGIALLLLSMLRIMPAFEEAGQHLDRLGWSLHLQRGGGLALLGTWLLCGLLFPSLLRMGTTDLDQYVVSRFFLLPDVYLGIFGGIALGALFQLMAQRPGATRLSSLLVALVLLLCTTTVLTQRTHVAARHQNWLEGYLVSVLQELPRNAVLLEASDDVSCFGFPYLQQIRKLRPDVRFICIPHLARRWYVERLKQQWPDFKYEWQPRHISSLSVIRHFLRQKASVHVTTIYNRSIQRLCNWVPYGLTFRAYPYDVPPPPPAKAATQLSKRFAKLKVQRPLPSPQDHPWVAYILGRYAEPWDALRQIFTQMGNTKAAQRCAAHIKHWTPPTQRQTKTLQANP